MCLLFWDVTWHRLTCITVFSSFTKQFGHNMYTRYGLQYTVDKLQTAALVSLIKAEGKHTSLTWNCSWALCSQTAHNVGHGC